MRIVIWSAIGRVGSYGTGVGKHVLRMSTGLAGRPGFDVRLLLTSDLWAGEKERNAPSPMDQIPDIRLPFSRRFAEGLWGIAGRPRVDRWVGDVDWVYAPRELYIPVGAARKAVTVHDLYRFEPAYRQLFTLSDVRRRWILVKALRDAELVFAVSEFTKGRIVDLIGVSAEKIQVVGNGVDEGFFEVGYEDPERINAARKAQYLLSVGGVTHKKGAEHLLAVAAQLRRRLPQLQWVVTGPVAHEFRDAVANSPNVRSVQRGFPDAEMYRLVRGASVALVLSEYEGFGIPALEAMAAGVPVIAAARASLPEVVGDAAILVEPTHTVATAETILDLIGDRIFRDKLVARGRERARQFPWPASVDRLVNALEEFGPPMEGS